ncbi:MAG: UDP-N-acetylglucosamine-transferase, partial [Limnohabitans sp.]|nr:UDP-N-acetylglucosamine-transferase [Limnohabitans sp.]
PYDPRLYFHGEEQSPSLRMFTLVWDIYHPSHIPLFHLYKMPNTPHETHHWHPNWDIKREVKFTTLTELAKQRLLDLVYQRRDLGRFGLGSERSVEDFAKLSGINYLTKRIDHHYQETHYGVDQH